jgi:hypothetical protein
LLCIEQNDEWLVGRAYLSTESISEVLKSEEQNSQAGQGEKRRNINRKGTEVAELRPEAPTSSPTRSALRSYTTSRDLTCLRTISQRAYLGKAQESRVLESRRDEQQPVVASQGFRSRPGARPSIRMSRTVAFIDRRRGMRNVKIGVVR